MSATQLFTEGVVVIPILIKEERDFYHRSIIGEIESFPEFPDEKTVRVLGGFGALGNPSSFHNLTVRILRQRVMISLIPFFKEFEAASEHSPPRNLEQLVDRLCIRRKGTQPTAESWHRDEAKDIRKGDTILGGWINLDLDITQYFSCVPRTHKVKNEGKGFARIPKEDKNKYKAKKQVFEVPPGHIILFYQHLVHEIIPKKAKETSYRLYMGWRLTNSVTPLNKDIVAHLKSQAPIPQPSGQKPALWSLNGHLNLHPDILEEWSEPFDDKFKEEVTNSQGRKILAVRRIMKSLKEYDLPLYEDYSDEEIQIVLPRKEWSFCGVKYRI